MVNRKETNLDGVKAMARTLLYTDINKTAYSPMIVQHPFTNTGFTMVRTSAEMYRKKIHQVCDRVERDFNDHHQFFTGWVDGKPVVLDSEYEVVLSADRKLIFVLLILNRRRELGMPIFQSDLDEFHKLCKQTRTVFPKRYFVGV